MSNEIEVRRPIPPAPIHPLAALITIILDNFFGVFEIIDPLLLLLSSLIIGVVGRRYPPQRSFSAFWRRMNGGRRSPRVWQWASSRVSHFR